MTFAIDTTPPAIVVAGVTDGQLTPGPVTPVVTVTDANPDQESITVDGVPFVSGQAVSAEGPHTMFVSATDKAGNQAVKTVAFEIDATPPVITIAGVADGQCTASPVTPTVTVTDANLSSTTSLLDGVPFVSGQAVSAEASHSLSVTADDDAGNTSEESVGFVIDATPPAIAVTGVQDGQASPGPLTPVVAITDSNLVSQTVLLNGQPFASGTEVFAEGTYTLEVSAQDCAGNTADTQVAFVIDATPPVVAVNGVSDGDFVSLPVTLTVTTNDATDVTLSVTLDGQPFANGSTVSAEGAHTLVATATDAAGNDTVRTVSFVIDTTDPVISVAGVTDGQCQATPITPTYVATDANLATVTATLNDIAFASGTPVSDDADYTLVVSAIDLAQNASETAVGFVIDSLSPMLSISGADDGVSYPSPIAPIAIAVDEHLTGLELLLDGQAFVSGTEVSAEGLHSLSATATDCAGNEQTDTRTFRIDLSAPVITISGVTDGQVSPDPVTPVITITDDDLLSQTILLDGAAFVSGTEVSAPGSHTLLVTATDGAGNQSTESLGFVIEGAAVTCPDPAVIEQTILLQVEALSGTQSYACAAGHPVVAVSQAELDAYLSDYGWDGARFHRLRVELNPTGQVEIHSPCAIELAGEGGALDITADAVCIYGRQGVRVADALDNDVGIAAASISVVSADADAIVSRNLTLSAQILLVQAAGTAKIGRDGDVTASLLEMISTGSGSQANAVIEKDSAVAADQVRMVAASDAHIGKQVDLTVTGDLTVTATGTLGWSQAEVRQGAIVEVGGDFSLTSAEKATVGPHASIEVDGRFEMDAGAANLCTLSQSATWVATTHFGNCLP